MRIITCLLIAIFFISVQTTLIKAFIGLTASFDLLIPFIIFLILFGSQLEIWLVILFGGVAVNMVSGAPIGIYLIIYVWIYVLFKNIKIYFQTPDSLLFVTLVIMSIMIEQLIFIVFSFFYKSSLIFSLRPFQIIFVQILLAFLFSPFLLTFFHKVFSILEQFDNGNKIGPYRSPWKKSKQQGSKFIF